MIIDLELENNLNLCFDLPWFLMVLELDFFMNHPISLSAIGNWYVVGDNHFWMVQIMDQIPIFFCVWIGLKKCRKLRGNAKKILSVYA